MTYDGSEETYTFVKCRDYHSHLNRLRHSPAIKTVLTSFDSPCFLSDVEVKDFIDSANPVVDTREFHAGDVVQIKNGFLSNLVGLIIKPVGKSSYSVAFSFHIRKFRHHISAKDLTLVGNIFKVVRSPVVSPRKVRRVVRRVSTCPRRVEKKTNGHRQSRKHRTTNRKCKKAGKR
jgi:hypothetical protein